MAASAPQRLLLPNVLAAFTQTPAGVWRRFVSRIVLTNRGVSIRENEHGEVVTLIPRAVARNPRAAAVLGNLSKGCVQYDRYGTAHVTLTKEQRRWIVRDVAEAWEILATRGIIPPEAVDDPRRRFACPACDEVCLDGSIKRSEKCSACSGVGTTSHPSSMPDVVSIASAWPSIVAAEALAGEVAHAYGERCDRVVWRVGRVPGVTEGPSLPPATRVRALGFAIEPFGDGTVPIVSPSVGV